MCFYDGQQGDTSENYEFMNSGPFSSFDDDSPINLYNKDKEKAVFTIEA
jgi:hypothetical protein